MSDQTFWTVAILVNVVAIAGVGITKLCLDARLDAARNKSADQLCDTMAIVNRALRRLPRLPQIVNQLPHAEWAEYRTLLVQEASADGSVSGRLNELEGTG